MKELMSLDFHGEFMMKDAVEVLMEMDKWKKPPENWEETISWLKSQIEEWEALMTNYHRDDEKMRCMLLEFIALEVGVNLDYSWFTDPSTVDILDAHLDYLRGELPNLKAVTEDIKKDYYERMDEQIEMENHERQMIEG